MTFWDAEWGRGGLEHLLVFRKGFSVVDIPRNK